MTRASLATRPLLNNIKFMKRLSTARGAAVSRNTVTLIKSGLLGGAGAVADGAEGFAASILRKASHLATVAAITMAPVVLIRDHADNSTDDAASEIVTASISGISRGGRLRCLQRLHILRAHRARLQFKDLLLRCILLCALKSVIGLGPCCRRRKCRNRCECENHFFHSAS